MIAWCQTHLQNSRFRFTHADIFSAVYNPKGHPIHDYTFPAGGGSMSLVVATSVFTHLLYRDFFSYLRESARILTRGGHLYASFFVMDFMKPMLGDRWSFSHKRDGCYVENLKYPEAAVAYDLEVIQKALSDNHFGVIEICNKDSAQQIIVAQRR
jgi:hypothetical protein